MDTLNHDLQHLLHGESETVEWKRSLSEAKEIVVSAAAFASLQGGQIGTGIQRILDDCRAQQLPEPVFEVQGSTFRAIFTPGLAGAGSERDVQPTDQQSKALDFMRQHGRITRAQYEGISGLPAHSAKRELARMVKAGWIVRRGGGRNFWYELRHSQSVPQTVPQDRQEGKT